MPEPLNPPLWQAVAGSWTVTGTISMETRNPGRGMGVGVGGSPGPSVRRDPSGLGGIGRFLYLALPWKQIF